MCEDRFLPANAERAWITANHELTHDLIEQHPELDVKRIAKLSAKARQRVVPGRVYIDAGMIPVPNQASPKAPEGAVADYSAVASLGGHFGVIITDR